MQQAFQILQQFFDHIYVVSIARAQHRHASIAQSLKGLDYELFIGADYQLITEAEMISAGIYEPGKARKNHRYGKPITGGMLACSLSHRMVYEDVLAKGYQRVLILEDDVLGRPEHARYIAQALAELPNSWELLYLDYDKNENWDIGSRLKQVLYHVQRFFGFMNYSHHTISHLHARPYSAHLRRAGFHDFTDAYAITREAAATLLRIQTPIQWFPDNLLAYACTSGQIEGYCLQHKLFAQTSQAGESLIRETMTA